MNEIRFTDDEGVNRSFFLDASNFTIRKVAHALQQFYGGTVTVYENGRLIQTWD